jgi:hypothetical protein
MSKPMIGKPRLKSETTDRVQWAIRMTMEQSDALEAWAERNGLSVAGAIRKCVSAMIGV